LMVILGIKKPRFLDEAFTLDTDLVSGDLELMYYAQ